MPEEVRLDGWKNIAGHLNVTVRTAQLWEAQGLPVRRTPTNRVYAAAAELDAWMRRSGPVPERPAAVDLPAAAADPAPAPRAQRPVLRSKRALWITTAAATLAAVLYSYRTGGRSGPETLRWDESQIIAADAAGREVWRRQFPNGINTKVNLTRLRQIADLDGDGTNEVVFSQYPAWGAESTGTPVICLDAGGTERWRFEPGRETRAAIRPSTYFVNDIRIITKANRRFLLVSSSHRLLAPSQVVLLDANGRTVSEFWHAGRLDFLEVDDLDRDGNPEAILGGVSNPNEGATLIVLDPFAMTGASYEEPGSKWEIGGIGVARERVRLNFPRSCINRKLHEYNWVGSLAVNNDEILVAVNEEEGLHHSVWYHFDRQVRLKAVTVGDLLLDSHRKHRLSGLLDHSMSPSEQAGFRAVRYLAGPLP